MWVKALGRGGASNSYCSGGGAQEVNDTLSGPLLHQRGRTERNILLVLPGPGKCQSVKTHVKAPQEVNDTLSGVNISTSGI